MAVVGAMLLMLGPVTTVKLTVFVVRVFDNTVT
jgi:hypothetical protein